MDGASSEFDADEDVAAGDDDKPLTERQRELLQQTLSGVSRFAAPASPPRVSAAAAAATQADTLVSSPASLRNARLQTLKQRQQEEEAGSEATAGESPARPQFTSLLLQEEGGEGSGAKDAGVQGGVAEPNAGAVERSAADGGENGVGGGGEVMTPVSATLLGSEWLSLTESSNLVLPSGAGESFPP